MANFKGINTEGIADAKEAIDIYVDDANRYLSMIKSPKISGAFKGNYAGEVQKFINAVVEEVRKPLNELKEFEVKIEEAKKRYEEKDDSIVASNVQ